MRALVISLCVVFALATVPAHALLSLLGIKNSMVEFLLDQISVEGELEITAETVEEPEDGSTAIRGLAVSDVDGVWLTVDSLNFAWNPSRLLRGEVEFSNLEAVGVTVLRKPVLPEAEEAPPPDLSEPEGLIPKLAWPRAPLAVRVTRMALETVSIEEGVLGHAIRFDATGAAMDEGDVQSARLALTRTDAITGAIAFDYARNFSDNTLKLTLDASEAAGGLVATLGGLPMDAPSEVRIDADGPPTDWRMAFALAVAGLVQSDGTAEIAYDGPLKVNAEFGVQPGPKLAPEIAAVLGEEAQLVARASEGADGTILIEDGRVTSPHAEVVASGTYSRTTGAMDLSLDLNAGPGLAQPFESIAFDGAGFDGVVKGQPGALRAEGTLALKGLTTAFVDLAEGEFVTRYDQTETGGETIHEASLSGQTQGLRLDQLQAGLIGPAETEIVATLTGDELELETAWLDSALLKTSVSGTANIATQDAELLFGLSTPELAPVASAYGVEVGGQIEIRGEVLRAAGDTDATVDLVLNDLAHEMADADSLALQGVVRQVGERIGFDLAGGGEALRIDRIGPRLLPKATLSGTGSLEGDALMLENFELASPLLNVAVAGTMNTGTGAGDVSYRVSTSELRPVAALYDQNLSGAVSANGKATLPAREGAGAPRVAGQAVLKTFRFNGQGYGDLTLTHDVEVSETPSGDLDVRLSRGPYAPGRVSTGFAFAPPMVTLSGLNAAALGVTAKAAGDVRINIDQPAVDGSVRISASDLKRLRALTGAEVGGALKGRLDLKSGGGRQDARFDLTGTSIASGGANVASVSLKGSARDVLRVPVVDVTAKASGVASGELSFEAVDATVKGPLSRLDVTAGTSGEALGKQATARFSARINAANPTIRARISALEASLDEDRVALVQPVNVTARGSVILIRDLDLALPDSGSLRGSMTYFGGPMATDLRLSAPRLGFLKRLADIPIASGSIDLQAAYDTRRGRSRGQGQIAGRSIVFEGVEIEGGMNLAGGFDWQGNRATAQGTLSGSFGDPMRFSADLPVRGGGPAPQLATRGAVSGKLDWKGQIGDLWALVPAPGHVLTGETTIDLGVTGDISDPQISGGISVAEGGYQNLDLGTILTDLSIDTTIMPGGDLGLSVKASDGAKGSVTTEGRVGLGDSGIDLETNLNSAVMVRRDDVTARTGGKIRVAGPLNAIAVTGGITVEEAEVRLVNANPPSIVTLGDVLIKGQPEPKEKDSSSSVTLDLSIDSPRRMFVRGRGLDSEWMMGLTVRGNAAQPRVNGSVDKVRGQLDLIGKSFDLERGRIFFDGGKEIDPLIDVVLTRETSDLTGRIIVDGPGSDPQLSFRSTPALPEDEVLPRTLFGKSSQALTGSQAISLGLGLATLMDGSGGTLDTVRGAVGLDSLRIDQDEDGNASVAAGKEVADGVWVGTKTPLGEGGTSVVVEIDVLEDIQLDTEVEAGGDASIGLEWKKDF